MATTASAFVGRGAGSRGSAEPSRCGSAEPRSTARARSQSESRAASSPRRKTAASSGARRPCSTIDPSSSQYHPTNSAALGIRVVGGDAAVCARGPVELRGVRRRASWRALPAFGSRSARTRRGSAGARQAGAPGEHVRARTLASARSARRATRRTEPLPDSAHPPRRSSSPTSSSHRHVPAVIWEASAAISSASSSSVSDDSPSFSSAATACRHARQRIGRRPLRPSTHSMNA